MTRENMNRRDFHKLTLAALGGTLSGSMITACSSEEKSGIADAGSEDPLLSGKHVCRGLNTCKGKGIGSDNECAGTGTCATAAHQGCGGGNECKGQGGCKQTAGRNACKGQGECRVPLSAQTWTKVRKKFETAMTKAGQKFGDAPAG